jgi:hypothetical protein
VPTGAAAAVTNVLHITPEGTTLHVSLTCTGRATAGITDADLNIVYDSANGSNPLLSGTTVSRAEFSGIPDSGLSTATEVSAATICLITGLTPGTPISMVGSINCVGTGSVTTLALGGTTTGLIVLNGLT